MPIDPLIISISAGVLGGTVITVKTCIKLYHFLAIKIKQIMYASLTIRSNNSPKLFTRIIKSYYLRNDINTHESYRIENIDYIFPNYTFCVGGNIYIEPDKDTMTITIYAKYHSQIQNYLRTLD